MSVVPFILGGNSPTVVDNQDAFEAAGGQSGKVILIQNLDREQLLDTDSSNVSYDLRVGSEYRDHRDSRKADVPSSSPILLQPGAAVIIETEEYVHFPKSRFGHIVPKVKLLQKGLSNTSSKIDPGYHGKLSITVFNLGRRTISLNKGDSFCTLYVLDVQDGAVAYNKEPKRIETEPIPGNFRKFRDFVEGNQALLVSLSLAISAVVGLVQVWQLTSDQKTKIQSPQKVDQPSPKK